MDKYLVMLTTNILLFQNSILKLICAILWPGKHPKNINNICIHRNGQIGDMICGLPAIWSIRKKFPNAVITLLSSPGSRNNPGISDLSEALPWIDHIEVYYDDVLGFSNIFNFLKKIKSKNFDLWVELPQDLTTFKTEIRNTFFVFLTRSRWAYGFKVNTILSFKKQQEELLTFKHEIETLLEITNNLGANNSEVVFNITPHANIISKIDRMIQKDNFDKNRPILGISPGAKRQANRWPVERFAEVARLWCNKGGYIYIFGSEADTLLGHSIMKKCSESHAVNLCGKTSLLETFVTLSYCSVSLTNDSGPMHLSVAAGVPCISIFSARDFSNKWFPWGGLNSTIKSKDKYSCSPCLSETCNNNYQCIMDISVDDVWIKLKYLQ